MKRTLSRPVGFRPTDEGDLRFLWVAYRKGLLGSLGEAFAKGDMEPAAFKSAIRAELIDNYDGIWTLTAKDRPIGFVLGFWAHFRIGVFMHVGDILWMPFTSSRDKIAAAVGFFEKIRHDIPMVEYAKLKDKKFFEAICAHGVMRRVGTSHSIYPSERVGIFETRRP